MTIHFPYQFDAQGRTLLADEQTHVRQLVEQLLFTIPGERVNRPNLGTPISQLIFEPASPEVANATQFLIQAALQQFLGDVIRVDQLDVANQDSTLIVQLTYMILRSSERVTERFEL